MRGRIAAFLVVCAVLACGSDAASVIRKVTAPTGVGIVPIVVEGGIDEGISGAARDAQGRLWAVTERQRSVLLMREQMGALRVHKRVVLDGVADGVECESLGVLADGRWVIGTESGEGDQPSLLLLVADPGGRARVQRTIPIAPASLGMHTSANHGIEGLCVAGGLVVLAAEERNTDGTATIATYDVTAGRWQPRRVKLTSDTGKLAGLDCRVDAAGAIEVVAIERHYGVGRVLAFSVDARAQTDAAIVATVLLDLGASVSPLPNFESVVWIDDALLLITDNHHGRVTGPTQALRITGLSARGSDQKR